jgi:chromosome segregation ATPase
MKRVLVVLLVAALVVAIPVAIKFGYTTKQLRQDLAAQADSLTTARTQLASANDSLTVKKLVLDTMTTKLDSATQRYERSAAHAEQLSRRVSGLTRRADSLKAVSDQLMARINTQADTLAGIRVQLTDTAHSLAGIRAELDSANVLVKQRTTLIAQVEPWYAKWKHDATQRSWLQKLFGANKAKAPSFAEPVFPNLPLDTTSTGSSAKLQASR